MKEQLISLKTAKLAKEKGFDWETSRFPGFQIYNERGIIRSLTTRISPTLDEEKIEWYHCCNQSLLQKWLREKYKLHVSSDINDENTWDFIIINIERHNYLEYNSQNIEDIGYNTYEEALEAGLYEALKLIK